MLGKNSNSVMIGCMTIAEIGYDGNEDLLWGKKKKTSAEGFGNHRKTNYEKARREGNHDGGAARFPGLKTPTFLWSQASLEAPWGGCGVHL